MSLSSIYVQQDSVLERQKLSCLPKVEYKNEIELVFALLQIRLPHLRLPRLSFPSETTSRVAIDKHPKKVPCFLNK